MLFARPEGGRELEPIAVLAALDFHELGYQRPTTAVEVSLDGLALRFEAKARFALLIRRSVEALLDGEAETITRKAIELAKAGDLAALRVCLDRIAPPRKDRPVLFELPPVSSAADAAKAAAALLEAVAVGDLTPAEASELGKLIEAYIKALEATDFAERLTKLERMTNR